MIPGEVILRLMKAPDKVKASVEMAAGPITEGKEVCQGITLISIGWDDNIARLLEATGL